MADTRENEVKNSQLKAPAKESSTQHTCTRCGEPFASLEELQHHYYFCNGQLNCLCHMDQNIL
jgi:hypothetical protein